MRKPHRWLPGLLLAIVLLGTTAGLARATEPLDDPRPADFIWVEIVHPRHGQVLESPNTTVRVRLHPLGHVLPDKLYRLHLLLSHHGEVEGTVHLDRQGNHSAEPIVLRPGEREVAVDVRLPDSSAIYSLEAYADDFVPFSNRAHVIFGVNSYLRQ
ncbi:MAG: hypothetical protein ACOY94_10345 [Bacillota bacterium]